ncbi:hypothetical protein DL93DRAFT_1412940 [Clavulina sp. PMI_390]|nr:hypothetical protein DL93DRAFT_1412940 [Clavulina sp. PMI_390]
MESELLEDLGTSDKLSCYQAIPRQLFMIREVLWNDEAFRQTRYVHASVCARLLHKAFAFLGRERQPGPHLNLTRSPTEAAFATTLRLISGCQDEAPQEVQLHCYIAELNLVHDLVAIMEASNMNKNMALTFQEHNGFQLTTNALLAARSAEMDANHQLHAMFGAQWFFAHISIWVYVLQAAADRSIISVAETAVDIKILYHVEWYTAFHLERSDKLDQRGEVFDNLHVTIAHLITLVDLSASHVFKMEFRHQLLSTSRRCVKQRDAQGNLAIPMPPELFYDGLPRDWLFPHDLISNVNEEPTCGALACEAPWGEDVTMLHCSRCRKMCYCSKACQKSHWKLHKPYCNPS